MRPYEKMQSANGTRNNESLVLWEIQQKSSKKCLTVQAILWMRMSKARTSQYGATPMYSDREVCSSSSAHGRFVAPFCSVLAPKMPNSGSGKLIGQDHCLGHITKLVSCMICQTQSDAVMHTGENKCPG